MTPATAAALRCPVCGGPLLLAGRSLRCARAHSFDLAKEGYAYLLPMQKKHAADPGDGKAMVRARRAFLSAGHYAPLMATLAADLNALGETLTYLSARTALTIDYTTAAVAAARGGVQLTEEGMAAVCALLL